MTSQPQRARGAGLTPLLISGLELANTTNAWRPLLRTGYPAMPCFLAGCPTSELPLHVLGLSILRLCRARRRGDLRGSTGAAAVGLTGLSWLGLAALYRRGLRSHAVLDAALRDAIDTAPDQDPVLGELDLKPSRSPLRRRRRFVSATGTQAYGDAGRRNLLDIWRHRDLPDDAKRPVILQVPGGGWMTGGRRGQAYPLLTHLAGAGWVAVSMAYRISPRHPWPAHLVDVKRALAWIKANIAEHGGDPSFIAVTGGSAGGHLAALAALTPHDRSLQPGFENVDLRVAAAVPIYGRYDWVTLDGRGRRELMAGVQRFIVQARIEEALEVFEAASPLLRVNADAPPFFVLHGDADSLIPVEEARAFVTALRGVSRSPVAYAELPGAQHAFEVFNSPRARNTARAVHQFLDAIHSSRTLPDAASSP